MSTIIQLLRCNNAIFIECRDMAMVLMTHLTTEERRQAYEDKFGQTE